MRKHILILCLIILFSICLVGCKESKNTDSQPIFSESQKAEKENTVLEAKQTEINCESICNKLVEMYPIAEPINVNKEYIKNAGIDKSLFEDYFGIKTSSSLSANICLVFKVKSQNTTQLTESLINWKNVLAQSFDKSIEYEKETIDNAYINSINDYVIFFIINSPLESQDKDWNTIHSFISNNIKEL